MSDSLRCYGPKPARLLSPWGFSRQEYWSGLSLLASGKLPNPGIEPMSPEAPALQAMYAHANFNVVFILLLNFSIGIYVSEQTKLGRKH